MNQAYKIILGQLNLGIILFDQHASLLYANDFIRDNYTRPITPGKSLFEQFPELPKEWFKKRVDSVMMFKNTTFTHWQYRPHLLHLMETRPITGTHDLMFQNTSLVYVGEFNQRSLIALIIQDSTQTAITQIKLTKTLKKLNQEHCELQKLNQKLEETQAQLVQNEKMAAVGQLSAGIAHEINNPMSFIKSNIECLQDYTQRLVHITDNLNQFIEESHNQKLRAEFETEMQKHEIALVISELPEILSETLDGTKRIQEITSSLRDFSRLNNNEWQQADIHQGIESTLKIVNHELKYTVSEIVRDYQELPLIECLPAQLNQVFLNLLINASQAINNQGKITIQTRLDSDANIVNIRITDNGIGIPESIQNKIFDPFFTTKEVGKGTGLGLSISYSIIKAHGGQLSVESKQGHGTSFLISLPVCKENISS